MSAISEHLFSNYYFAAVSISHVREDCVPASLTFPNIPVGLIKDSTSIYRPLPVFL